MGFIGAGFQSFSILAPTLASAHNLIMPSSLQDLQGHLDAGRLDEALGPAHYLLDSYEEGAISTETLTQLRQLVESDATRATGLRSILAVSQALQVREGLDAYHPSETHEELAVNIQQEKGASLTIPPGQESTSWGRRLFARARRFSRGPWRRIQDRLFAEMLANETLKRQMIAFMDAVAGIDNPTTIAELTRLYFPRGQTHAGGLLGRLLRIGTASWLPDRIMAWGLKRVVKSMARRFLAGSTVETALKTVARLQRKGIYTSVDVVRERVLSQREADDYKNRVLQLMDLWDRKYTGLPLTKGGVPVRHVSVKLSALTHRFDPLATDQVIADAGGRLLEIFKQARDQAIAGRPVLVNIDLEEHHVRDLSYRIFWETLTHPELEGWDYAGVVIQSYLQDSEQVLLRNLDLARRHEKKIQVRIVKGAYHKYEQIEAARRGWKVPVFLRQEDTDRNFQRLADLALQNADVVHPATGSHNIRDVGVSQDARESLQLPQALLEAQVLLGVGDPIAAATRFLKIPSRYYGPFGTTGEAIGYLVRRLAEVGPDSAIGKTHVSGDYEQYQRASERLDHEAGTSPLGTVHVHEPRFALASEADFSNGEVRAGMERALDQVLNEEMSQRRIVLPLIGQADLKVVDEERLVPIENPADLKRPLGYTMWANEEDVEQAIAAAQLGYREWSGQTAQERARVFNEAAAIVLKRQYEIAATIVAEVGKPWDSALAETREAMDFLRSYAVDALREGVDYDARGVGVAISPFNFPFAIMMGQVTSGLALGNAMIAKPAEQTPRSSALALEILREAGAPKNAVQYLPGSGEVVGQKLVESHLVDFIAFTGSEATARIIQRTAAAHPSERRGAKIVVVETGGKNPLIVDETADLDVAVSAVLEGAFQFNGQRCSATSRVIVVDSIKEKFLERLKEGARSMVLGNPCDPQVQLGPQIDRVAHQKALRYVRTGLDDANLLYKGDVSPIADLGYYMAPHIFTNVAPDAVIAQEEIFAPILSVISAASFDEALDIANASRFALTAALISRHPGHIRTFLAQMEAGNKYVNRSQLGARPWEGPFGGFKNSGTGPKAGGRDIVARFGVPKGKQRQLKSILHLKPQPNTRPLKTAEAARQAARLHAARKRWQDVALIERIKYLYRLIAQIEGLKKSYKTNSAGTGPMSYRQMERAEYFLVGLQGQLTKYLSLHETIHLPGERNEIAFDQPLGLGLIWEYEESFANMLVATMTAVMMGNAVAISTSTQVGQFVLGLMRAIDLPENLVQGVKAESAERLIQSPEYDFDFVVAHGPFAQDIQRLMHGEAAEYDRVGFRRFIGGYDDPAESRYATYFAHATTRTERTLRHGADLDLRMVLR